MASDNSHLSQMSLSLEAHIRQANCEHRVPDMGYTTKVAIISSKMQINKLL